MAESYAYQQVMSPRVVVSISRYYRLTAGQISEVVIECKEDEVEAAAQRAIKKAYEVKEEYR